MHPSTFLICPRVSEWFFFFFLKENPEISPARKFHDFGQWVKGQI